MTPLQSIRKHCTWCCNDQTQEAALCPAEKCPVYSYRTGKMPKIEKPSPLNAIRLRCLDCVQAAQDVRECNTVLCWLHEFRLGLNPNYSDATREKLRQRALTGRSRENPRSHGAS